MLHRLHLGRAALTAVLLCLAAPAAALADGVPVFTVGPVQVNHGYTVTAAGFGCDTKYAAGNLTFAKARSGWTETHTYSPTGGSASCHVAKDLSSGSLKFSLGNDATVNITFSKRGSKKAGSLPPGCTGTAPDVQDGIAKGKFNVKLHSSFFGKVDLQRIRASVQSSPNFTCHAPPGFKKTYFLDVSTGGEGSGTSLNASLPPGGPATLSFFSTRSSSGMFESHTLTLMGGNSLFTAKPDLSSAEVNGAKKLKGQLKFTATPSCQGNSRTGMISGSVTANLDVIGPQTIKPGTPPPYADLSRNASGQPCS